MNYSAFDNFVTGLENAAGQAAVKPVLPNHHPRTIRVLNCVPRLVSGRVKQFRMVATCCLLVALLHTVQAAPLMEEGFSYPAGTSLAANSPWSGSPGQSLAVVSGNLTYSNLQEILVTTNNLLRIGGGGSVSAHRNFSASPVASAEGVAVYLSALVNCTLVPTNRQFIACMLPAGTTSANAPNDPIDLYMTPATFTLIPFLARPNPPLPVPHPVATVVARTTTVAVLMPRICKLFYSIRPAPLLRAASTLTACVSGQLGRM